MEVGASRTIISVNIPSMVDRTLSRHRFLRTPSPVHPRCRARVLLNSREMEQRLSRLPQVPLDWFLQAKEVALAAHLTPTHTRIRQPHASCPLLPSSDHPLATRSQPCPLRPLTSRTRHPRRCRMELRRRSDQRPLFLSLDPVLHLRFHPRTVRRRQRRRHSSQLQIMG